MNNYNHLTIKQLPLTERPYEKLEKYGESALTDAELLAIIIKTGTKQETAVSLSQRILSNSSKWAEDITDISLNDLKQIKGIGRVKSIQIKAVLELGKRLVKYKVNSKVRIRSPKDVYNLLIYDMRFLKKEYVKILILDTKNQVIKITDIAVGSLNSSIVHPREVFREAIKCGGASIILVHNHPSGDPTPSAEDISITKRLFETSKIIGIELLDHLILGDISFISLKEKNIF